MQMIPLVTASEPGRAQHVNPRLYGLWIVVLTGIACAGSDVSLIGRERQRE